LFNDPHLIATDGLGEIEMSSGPRSGTTTKTPLLPITMDGKRLQIRLNPPKLGEHTQKLVKQLGYTDELIEDLILKKIIK
jgi:crotonobetainyl-CoA:carnitine CoA-transferase CaiB-like acyl-CoA transferase